MKDKKCQGKGKDTLNITYKEADAWDAVTDE